VYKEHPYFEAPSEAALLWRYMDLTKLIALLHGKCLFFARADRLGDPWEGATSEGNATYRRILESELGTRQGRIGKLYESTRRHTYVSCWHENPGESAAMWTLYLKGDEGIAIQTTFERLRNALDKEPRDVHIGKVRYYNPKLEILPEGNVLRQYLNKRKSFEHEHEVRAIFQDYSNPRGFDGEPLEEFGLNIAVDIEMLIQEVYLAPTSPDWLAAVVQAVLDRFDIKRTVRHSALADDPIF
jgi:hypothetical protein